MIIEIKIINKGKFEVASQGGAWSASEVCEVCEAGKLKIHPNPNHRVLFGFI
jgi:hypothetical protein